MYFGASDVFWGLILRVQVCFGELGMFKGFKYGLEDRVCFGGVLWVWVCLGGQFWGVTCVWGIRCVFGVRFERCRVLGGSCLIWGVSFGCVGSGPPTPSGGPTVAPPAGTPPPWMT